MWGGGFNNGQDSGGTSVSLELKMGAVFGKVRKKSVILGCKQTLISFDYLQIFWLHPENSAFSKCLPSKVLGGHCATPLPDPIPLQYTKENNI